MKRRAQIKKEQDQEEAFVPDETPSSIGDHQSSSATAATSSATSLPRNIGRAPDSLLDEKRLLEVPPTKSSQSLFEIGCDVLWVNKAFEPPTVSFATVQSVFVDLSSDLSRKFVYRVQSDGHSSFARQSELRWAANCPVWIRWAPVSQEKLSIPAKILGCYEVPSTGRVHYSAQEVGEDARIFHGLGLEDIRFRPEKKRVSTNSMDAPLASKRPAKRPKDDNSSSMTAITHGTLNFIPAPSVAVASMNDSGGEAPFRRNNGEQGHERQICLGHHASRRIVLPRMVDADKVIAEILGDDQKKHLGDSLNCTDVIHRKDKNGMECIDLKGDQRNLDSAVEEVENVAVRTVSQRDQSRALFHLAQRCGHRGAVYQRLSLDTNIKKWMYIFYFPKDFDSRSMGRFVKKQGEGLSMLRRETRCDITLRQVDDGVSRAYLIISGDSEWSVNEAILLVQAHWDSADSG